MDEELTNGNGGWVRYQSTAYPHPVFVRLEDRAGRLGVVDLFLPALTGVLDANVLRRVPLGRIEAWVNADSHIAATIRLATYGPDLRTAISYYGTTVGTEDSWPADMLRRHRLPPRVDPLAEPIKVKSVRPDLRLDVPASRPFGDDFYRALAEVWQAAVKVYRSPAGAVSDANTDVSVSQVHRWVKVARERGLLNAGHPGKA